MVLNHGLQQMHPGHIPKSPQKLPRDPELLLKRGEHRIARQGVGKVLANDMHRFGRFDHLLVGPDMGGGRRRRRRKPLLQRPHRLLVRNILHPHIIPRRALYHHICPPPMGAERRRERGMRVERPNGRETKLWQVEVEARRLTLTGTRLIPHTSYYHPVDIITCSTCRFHEKKLKYRKSAVEREQRSSHGSVGSLGAHHREDKDV